MGSQVYRRSNGELGFDRIIRVSHDIGGGNYAVATELGDQGNIAAFVEHAEASLAKDRGCCEARLDMLAFNASGSLIKLNNPPLLVPGDLVEFIPEAGADPFYAGIVLGPPRRDHRHNHFYTLDGLHIQLQGKPPVESGTVAYGALSTTNPTVFYVSSGSGMGIVQALCYAVVEGETGILLPTDWEPLYDNMTYNPATKINLFECDPKSTLAQIFDDLARACPDDTPSHAGYEWPVIWGVDHNRTFYFQYRPNVEVMGITTTFDPRYPEGRPVITMNSTEVECEEWELAPGMEYRNQVVLTGGVDPDGNAIEVLYKHPESIAHYKRIRMDCQEIPMIRSASDAARWKAGYFQRYAYAQTNFRLSNIAIPSAAAFPYPWKGYCQLTTPELSGLAGQRSINGFSFTFDETPTITEIVTGEIDESASGGRGGSVRWPGNAHKERDNRIPRAAKGGGGAAQSIPQQTVYITNFGYPFHTGGY